MQAHATITNTEAAPELAVYLDEYTRGDIIARYISQTAGAGIAYVLSNVYAPIYLEAIRQLMATRPKGHKFRVLEYGCGGGMNLLKIVELLRSQQAQLDHAFGADFSHPMIEAARQEAAAHLPRELNAQLTYVVANNESLMADLVRAGVGSARDIVNSFDLIVGVNTFRYSHRLRMEDRTAQDIHAMLRPGGISIMIDMNRNFPFFRSKVRRMFKARTMETYVPSLKEYTRPFVSAGFAVRQSKHFCWVPHSASPGLLALCRAATPVFDLLFRPFAMRSLVIGQKAAA